MKRRWIAWGLAAAVVAVGVAVGAVSLRGPLVDAVVRETLEETAYHFRPTHVVGVYHWKHPTKEDTTYLRFAFGGELLGFEPERKLDDGIVAARWLTLDEVRATRERHRSPLILQCCEDYLAGPRYPLGLIRHYDA